jgi:hypothetical protein
MSLTHAFVSPASSSSDPNVVDGPKWNGDHLIDGNGANMVLSSALPATPAAGKGALLGRDVAGGALPGFIGPDGRAFALQPFLGQRRTLWWQPIPSVASASLSLMGGALSTVGTFNARTSNASNMFTLAARYGLTTNATPNLRAAAYFNQNLYVRGNAANFGGFRAVFRFGISDPAVVATANMFVGMVAASSMLNTAEPSAAVNMIGIGHDSTDTVMQLITNDGTGIATKVPLGAGFPINTQGTDVYELALYCAPNSGSIGVQVTRLNTGDVFRASVISDLPVATQAIYPGFFRGNMSTALGVGIDVFGLYVETEV